MKKFFLPVIIGCLLTNFVRAQNVNLDSIINAQMINTHTPGVSALILKKGIPVWQHNYGYARLSGNIPVTGNTSFMLGSTSKTFIAVAIMKMVEQGFINLDTTANTYLPFAFHNPYYPDSTITVRQLLTYTATIRDHQNLLSAQYVFNEDSQVPLADFMFDYFDQSGTNYSAAQNFYNVMPGTQSFYSNEGAVLAAYLVETTSGISFAEYCNQNIFTPLCMNNTSWFLSSLDTNNVAMPYKYSGVNGYVPIGYYCFPDYPGGQLRTSVISLGKFLAMMMNNGSLNNQQILNTASVNEIFTRQIPGIDSTKGLLWYQKNIGGRNCWGHYGGDAGVSSNMYFSPDDSTGIILLANGGFPQYNILDAMFDYAEGLVVVPADSFTCGVATGIAEQTELKNSLSIFPNPTSSIIYLEGVNDEAAWIELSDLSGRILLSKNLPAEKTIDLSSFSEGIYFLKVSVRNPLEKQGSADQVIKVLKQ